MAKLAGLDLAGWHDAACCNYDLASGEATAEGVVVDGGIGAVVVDMTVGGTKCAVAGPQAILSPIGRGYGWSKIGDPKARRSLRARWKDLFGCAAAEPHMTDFAAGVTALAAGAERVLFCVPDRPEMSERPQQMLLRGLTGRGRSRPTLLWRSVAVLLDALDGGRLSNVAAGMMIVVLTHEGDGIAMQRFVLRGLDAHDGVLAPERAAVGRVFWPTWGLECLLETLTRELHAANPALEEFGAETPRLPLTLLLIEPPFELPEIIRRDNGDWLQIDAPVERPITPDFDVADPDLPPADLVLVTSPLAARHRDRLEADVRRAWPGVEVMALNPASAARGALYAAERIARDIPHYLDRLDPIALAVLRDDEPVFQDLIPRDATVPGNREYVSEPITTLMWATGMTQANFYIQKGEREIRHWKTAEMEAPSTAQPLILHLRQTPAQGWATLTVTSPTWELLRARPIVLDWNSDELKVDERSPEEILNSLERPPPVVPNRIRHEAHIGLWNGEFRRPGLLSVLRSLDAASPDDLSGLVAMLRSSYTLREKTKDGLPLARQVYAIGSDGEVPSIVAPADVARLDRILAAVAQRMATVVAKRRPPTNNELLLTATWAFGRCPAAVQTLLVDAYLQDRNAQPHPLVITHHSRRALIHGLGRCISDGALAVRLIRSLLDGEPSSDALGAAGALLSRPVATPLHLSDEDMGDIVGLLIKQFRRIRRGMSFGVTLKYALLCAAGLLRIRERLPRALIVRSSVEAQQLLTEIEVIADQIELRPGRPVPGRAAKLAIMGDLIEYLNGTGGNPDILTNVATLSDDKDGGDRDDGDA
ncbi:hypothetical protein EYW49_09015 [Siculibacillus lacustris]|uniref:Uncharacterized protein n=1 Tax=Siculibacillus lacustris TaxID=1549641 RepID=A0A4Q9VR85_9HYPH|nr:hypothetical protein [Siculibacillus lacustris]TBW38401.1 hypothetical protein EYW49_09015 [Siculibacillus lacustris]